MCLEKGLNSGSMAEFMTTL